MGLPPDIFFRLTNRCRSEAHNVTLCIGLGHGIVKEVSRMELLHTRICELLGIRYPIIQGPMALVSGPELVAAVSNAGGLGVLSNQLAQAKGVVPKPGYELPTVDEWLRSPVESQRAAIKQVRSLTDRPFGVHVGIDGVISPEWMAMAAEENVSIAVTSGGHPGYTAEFFKNHGFKIIHMGSTVKHAKICQEVGVDAFVLSGYEGGGHDPGGSNQTTTFAGLPQVVDAVDIPVIAAGGVGDGRGLIAATVLGAEGVRVGTRFAATVEASNHINHKQAIVDASDTGTVYNGLRWNYLLRSLRTQFVDHLYELERSDAPLEKVWDYIGGKSHEERAKQRKILGEVEGDLENGEMYGGLISGLVHEILPATEVIRRMVAEAEAILRSIARKAGGK